jgi:hypothetical protein
LEHISIKDLIFSKFGNDTSDYAYIDGGVPQGSKLGSTAFVIKIDKLPSVMKDEIQLMLSINMEANVILEHDRMFMDDFNIVRGTRCQPPYFWHATGWFWEKS